jgi:transposase
MNYSSSLTEQEWDILDPPLPVKKRMCPAKWSKREILDGVFYRNKNGCTWSDLPKDVPPYRAVYWHYKHWRAEGVLDNIRAHLHGRVREEAKKKPLDKPANRGLTSGKKYL